MFFSHFVLAKKGPLARIWLAAHWDKKLTKAHILEINIERSVEGILQPKIKLALRTSGHLLLGVVRIYSRKAKYLLAECNEAFVKIKMAFRPGIVDLPEGNREAALATITLPEVFHDFENISDITIQVNTPTTLHQSRAEDITLKEDYGTLCLMGDDGFADIGFDDPEMVRDATNIDEGFDQTGLLITGIEMQDCMNEPQMENIDAMAADQMDTILANDNISEKEAEEDVPAIPSTSSAMLFESGLFEDAPPGPTPDLDLSDPIVEDQHQQLETGITGVPPPEISDDDTYGGPPSVGLPSPPSSPDSTLLEPPQVMESLCVPTTNEEQVPNAVEDEIQLPISSEGDNQIDEEAFALAPLETVIHKGPERTKSKRKRKLIIDEVKNISGEEMKSQLSDTRDIISTLDLAPPTKRLMHWKESGGVEKLFALPGRCLQSLKLSRLYLRHLTTRSMMDEEFETDSYPTLEDMKAKESPRELARACKRLRRSEPEEDLFREEPVPAEPVFASSTPFKEVTETVLNMNEDTMIMPEPEPTLQLKPQEELLDPVPELLDPVPQLLDPVLQLLDPVPELLDPVPEVLDSVPEVLDPIPEPLPAPIIENIPEAIPSQEVIPEIIPESEDIEDGSGKECSDTQKGLAESLFDSLNANISHNVTESENVPSKDQKAVELSQQPFLDLEDDDDDYHNPASVGAPDEQLGDETYEQFEERVHGKRATHMLHVLKQNLYAGNKIPFSALTRGNIRKQVAQKFYTLLVLKKQQAVELEQSAPYEEIYISSGTHLDAVLH